MKLNRPLRATAAAAVHPPAPALTPVAVLGNRILQDGEPLIGLAVAGRPTGAHPSTVSRWASRGIRTKSGPVVKLETVRCGGKLKTSTAAVLRFLAALSEATTPAPPTPTAGQRCKAAEAAARELERMGA